VSQFIDSQARGIISSRPIYYVNKCILHSRPKYDVNKCILISVCVMLIGTYITVCYKCTYYVNKLIYYVSSYGFGVQISGALYI